MKLCTCLIPVYNEEKRILQVLKSISRSKKISEIFCVDDGSTDNTYKIIKENYPKLNLINLGKNYGKTKAIIEGLKKVKTKYTLMIDGDLIGLKYQDLDNAIDRITKKNIDMIILRRVNEKGLVRFLRFDTILSGQRILKTSELKKIVSKNIKGYQIETVINKHMDDNSKSVFWMPTSAVNSIRANKWGIKKSIISNIQMFFQILVNPGPVSFLKQILIFCRIKA